MNTKRVASLSRQIGTLFIELADAIEDTPKPRKKVRRVAAPTVQPSEEALDKARRALRKQGVVV